MTVPGNNLAPARRRYLALALIYLLASLPVTFVFIAHPGLTGHPEADFGQMIDATASRPYVTRALVPFVVRTTAAALPESATSFIADHMRGRRLVRTLGWEDPRLVEYAVATVVFVACFVGFAFVLRRLAAVVYDFPAGFRDLAPLIALAALPLCFRYYSYPYDPATLLLFSLGVLFIVEARDGPFMVALVLAALNKETSILLVLLYTWNRIASGRGRVVLHAGLVMLVWCGVRVILELVFRDHPGAIAETHLDHTVWLFTEFPARLWYALAVVALLAAAIVSGWKESPRFARAGLLLTVLPLFAAALFFGFVDELRGYYEAAPFIFLLALPGLHRVLSAPANRPA